MICKYCKTDNSKPYYYRCSLNLNGREHVWIREPMFVKLNRDWAVIGISILMIGCLTFLYFATHSIVVVVLGLFWCWLYSCCLYWHIKANCKEKNMTVRKLKWYETFHKEDIKDALLFAIGPTLVIIGCYLSLK